MEVKKILTDAEIKICVTIAGVCDNIDEFAAEIAKYGWIADWQFWTDCKEMAAMKEAQDETK